MMQAIEKMGYDRFYQYLELFGMTAKTGIDLPGEAVPLVQDKQVSGPVGLATMSFGMGINITPIEMISAVSAIGNNGILMKPRLVRGLADSNGNMVEEFPSKIVRQVVSEQTAAEVKAIMNYVSEAANVQVASVPGYHIGTKTGTAQKLIDGQYSTSEVIGSMVAVAPIDNPRFVVIVVVDNPKIGEYGVSTAGPAVRKITEKVLRYMNVKPAYTEEELAKQERERIDVPDLRNKAVSEAGSILMSIGLQCSVQGGAQGSDFAIVDQYPKPGERISPGGVVYLYGS
jgi:stage V sporulation protein D (sporulation-specific penicillin-binding protein)